MDLPLYQVDAFTDQAFGGNPAAVCPLDEWLPNDTLQNIAMENNLSETAFFVQNGDHYDIRWLTPTVEVDLCGHATLASAYVILNILTPDKDTVTFNSRSGKLTVSKTENGLMMDFPVWEHRKIEIDERVSEALGAKPKELHTGYDWVAVFENEEQVRSLTPDMQKLISIETRGILATAPGTKGIDFVSRFFAPAVGVPEDPVTGSAHCILTPYWAERLGKTKLNAYQASKRGGKLFCEQDGNRVKISGNAALYLTGTIHI